MRWLISDALATGNLLRAQVRHADRFFSTRRGADLWIDGVDFIVSTPAPVLSAYCGQLAKHIQLTAPKGQLPEAVHFFAGFDEFLRRCAAAGEAYAYHALAAGLCCLDRFIPSLRRDALPFSVVNDSLLMLVSPHYRAIRCAAFNSGLEVGIQTGNGWFRPDFGWIIFAPPVLIPGRPRCVQSYSFIHEVCHAVLFGDAYCRTFGSLETTQSILIAIEESIIGLDLLTYGALRRASETLHAVAEFEKVSIGNDASVERRISALHRGAIHPNRFVRALRAAAQRQLGSESPVSRIIEAQDSGEDASAWVGDKSIAFHIAGLRGFTDRVFDPRFRSIVDILPPDPVHASNARAASTEKMDAHRPFFGCQLETLCADRRKRNKHTKALRNFVIRGADLVSAAGPLDPRASEVLASAMQEIAWQMVACKFEGDILPWAARHVIERLQEVVPAPTALRISSALKDPFTAIEP